MFRRLLGLTCLDKLTEDDHMHCESRTRQSELVRSSELLSEFDAALISADMKIYVIRKRLHTNPCLACVSLFLEQVMSPLLS